MFLVFFVIDRSDIPGCEVTLCRNYLRVYYQVGYAERKLMVLQGTTSINYFFYVFLIT